MVMNLAIPEKGHRLYSYQILETLSVMCSGALAWPLSFHPPLTPPHVLCRGAQQLTRTVWHRLHYVSSGRDWSLQWRQAVRLPIDVKQCQRTSGTGTRRVYNTVVLRVCDVVIVEGYFKGMVWWVAWAAGKCRYRPCRHRSGRNQVTGWRAVTLLGLAVRRTCVIDPTRGQGCTLSARWSLYLRELDVSSPF
jgi:hypothetical protein